MGTTTIFLRFNDLHGRMSEMTPEQLKQIDEMKPWDAKNTSVKGWSASLELHNGNIHPLIWWRGQLFHLNEAPERLSKKYYNRNTGKTNPASEWTLLRKHLEDQLKELDRRYRKTRARKYREKRRQQRTPNQP